MAVRREYRVLGPLEAVVDGEPVRLGGARPRAVLALLLLDANRVVSADRLIDAIWGERPPETATTALQGHISQLRRGLERPRGPGDPPTVLVTEPPGYRLIVAPDELDADRFRVALEHGQELLAGGNPEGAARALRGALDLFRGPPLADVGDAPFAPEAARRLEELRAQALEARFEAELALGRDRELVPELDEAVTREPYRERLHGQLMLALYRSGRQAEALDAYRRAREVLAREIGIEPGQPLRDLHEAILAQAPALAAPRAPARNRTSALRPRRRRWLAAGLAALIAAVAAAVVLALGGGDDGSPAVHVVADSVALVDPGSARVIADVRVGGTPTSVSAGAGGVWVLNADDQTISRIDPRTRGTQTFATGATPTDLAAGADGVWVGDHARVAGAQFVGPVATGIARVDPDSRVVRRRIPLPRSSGTLSNVTQDHVAVGAGGVWAIGPDYAVVRIDPRSERVTATVRSLPAIAVATGQGQVWVLAEGGVVARIDPRTAAVTRRIRIAAATTSSLAVGGGAVWVSDPQQGTLWRVDTGPRLLQRTIPVGEGASSVAYSAGRAWVANSLTGTLARVDASDNRVTATVPLGGTPRSIAISAAGVWVTVGGGPGTTAPTDARLAGPAEGGSCGPVFYAGPGKPDRIVVSDLPLHAAPGIPVQQLSQAIAVVLRRHGFRAGRWRVGYRSCDDSTAQSGIFDPRKCAGNARAFAADPAVIGVIGPYNSGCAGIALPVLSRRRNGPLATISPTASARWLTRPDPGGPPLRELYPDGERNFVRLYAHDDAQGAAGALFLQRRGTKRVFVLHDDDEGYGIPVARGFRATARARGLRVVGEEQWQRKARSYARLAARVAAARPDAVYLSGLIDTNGGSVLAAIRRRLGPGPAILVTDGFLPIPLLFDSAGNAARGVYLSFGSLVVERLGAAGRRFARDFSATQSGRRVHPQAVYAAQAAEVLLSAIARSDGGRASVNRALAATRVRNGLLGSFHFDRGDAEPAPITVLRVVRPGSDRTVAQTDGAEPVAVIAPPAQ